MVDNTFFKKAMRIKTFQATKLALELTIVRSQHYANYEIAERS